MQTIYMVGQSYFLDVDAQYLENLQKLQKAKSLWLIYMIKLTVIPIRNLKQVLNNGLILKKLNLIKILG